MDYKEKIEKRIEQLESKNYSYNFSNKELELMAKHIDKCNTLNEIVFLKDLLNKGQ